MRYVRVYADEAGESHFADVEVPLVPVDYAPPAPPLHLSSPTPARAFVFLAAPPEWEGDWHPAPMRQMIFYLSGEVEAEVSDGEVRRFGPGSATLGRGHHRQGAPQPGRGRGCAPGRRAVTGLSECHGRR